MIVEYLVVVMLTFMDGSVVQYNKGEWETVTSYKECRAKVKIAAEEMKEDFKDADPKPSMFILMCLDKNKKE